MLRARTFHRWEDHEQGAIGRTVSRGVNVGIVLSDFPASGIVSLSSVFCNLPTLRYSVTIAENELKWRTSSRSVGSPVQWGHTDVLPESKGSLSVWVVPLRGCSAAGWVSTAGMAVTGENICVSDGEKEDVLWGLPSSHPLLTTAASFMGSLHQHRRRLDAQFLQGNPSPVEISFSRGSSLVGVRRNKGLHACHLLSWVCLHISSPGLLAAQLLTVFLPGFY